jgi:hypothetical protein
MSSEQESSITELANVEQIQRESVIGFPYRYPIGGVFVMRKRLLSNGQPIASLYDFTAQTKIGPIQRWMIGNVGARRGCEHWIKSFPDSYRKANDMLFESGISFTNPSTVTYWRTGDRI